MTLDITSLTPREQVSAIYIAYYDRAPDPAGLDFWVGTLTSNQLTLSGIAQAFSTAAETKLKYPFFNNPNPDGYSDFVDAIYQNLFGRAPDDSGKAFWTTELSTGSVQPGEFILEVLKGARDVDGGPRDLSTIQNKIVVAEDWAADAAVKNIGTSQTPFAEEVEGQFFVRDAAVFGSATSILDSVTGDAASVTNAKAATDTFFAGQGSNTPPPAAPQTVIDFIANATEYGIGNADPNAPQAGVHTLLDSDADNASDTTFGKESHWEGEGKFNTAASLTYGFVNTGGQMIPSDEVKTVNASYTDAEKLFIRSVFNTFSNIGNITFTEVADAQSLTSADIRLGKGTAEALGVDESTLGFAYQPNNASTTQTAKQSTQDEQQNSIGDFFLVTDAITVDGVERAWTVSTYDDVKNTISHELGHVMGLDHPFRSESGNGAGFRPIGDTGLVLENYTGQQTGGGHQSSQTDNMIETIMTYYNPSDTRPININNNQIEGVKVTNWKPGIMDIAALQHLYGTNTEYNKGDTVYTYDAGAIVYDSIWDAGGNDTIRLTGTGSNTINLNDGSYSKLGVMASRMYDVTNATLGLSGDAVITAVTAKVGTTSVGLWDNITENGSKAQFAVDLPTLKGLTGPIELTFAYMQGGTTSNTSVTIGNASDFYLAGETEFNFGIAYGVIIENIETGDGADIIVGNEAGNIIFAAGGNNTLTGNAGADTFAFKSATTAASTTVITDFIRGSDKLRFEGQFEFSTNAESDNGWMLAWDNGNHSITLAGVTSFDLATDAIM